MVAVIVMIVALVGSQSANAQISSENMPGDNVLPEHYDHVLWARVYSNYCPELKRTKTLSQVRELLVLAHGLTGLEFDPGGRYFEASMDEVKKASMRMEDLTREDVCRFGDATYGPDGVGLRGLLAREIPQ